MIKIFATSFLTLINLYALDISKQKVFTVSVTPTTQTSSFSLSHIAKTSKMIETLFAKAIKLTEKSDICKDGQYRIYPDYKYVENRKVEIGYNSNINFNCEFDDYKKYERLLTKIKKLNLKLTQNKISYKVSEQTNEKEKSKLEFISYNYGKQYSSKLNKVFNNCKIKSIALHNSYNAPVQYKALARQESTTVTSPIKDDIQISLNVNYIFQCEN